MLGNVHYWNSSYTRHMRNPKKSSPWSGPIKLTFVSITGNTKTVDIREQTATASNFFSRNKVIGVCTEMANGELSVEHLHPTRISKIYFKAKNGVPFVDLKQAIKEMMRSYKAIQEEEKKIEEDPTLYLERILKERDWYACMSDDYAYWSAGEKNRRDFEAVVSKVKPEVVRKLWSKYAPREFKCPV